MTESAPEEPTFAQLNLDPRIIAAVTKLGFSAPTPIQARAIPPLLEGRDLVGRARTGSGKTAAFGLPLIHMLARGGEGVRALVLAPTRELALQISAALRTYSTALHLKLATLYGGAAYQPQLAALRRGADVVVGTPGRLVDHLTRGTLDLSSMQLLVIDEADEMLRMGFVDDLTKILQATPDTRQVALFSATMPAPIRAVAEKYLHLPLEVQVEQRRIVVDHIEQYRIDVPDGHKLETLIRVLKSKPAGATLIFARTRLTCADLAQSLRDAGFDAQALHGDMGQPAREQVLGALRSHRLELVVATDVAARGIDVEHLTHVINFDLPEEVEIYVNRIGRTGRAGRKGVAVSLVARRDQRLLQRIEQLIKAKIDRRAVPSDAQVSAQHRRSLEEDLSAALQHKNRDDARALLGAMQQGAWTVEALAAAALGLLMRDRHLEITAEPSAEPPSWARRRARSTEIKPRGVRGGPGATRAQPGSRHDRPGVNHDRSEAEAVTLTAAVGREHGIGPNDVVGALARELGVPTKAIGRINIEDRQLTVALSAKAAATIARKPTVVYLRGNPVSFTKSRGGPVQATKFRGGPVQATKSRGPVQAPAEGAPQPKVSNTPRCRSSAPREPGPAAGFYDRADFKKKPSKGKLGKGNLGKNKAPKGRKSKGKGKRG